MKKETFFGFNLLLGHVDICVIMVICQPSPYLIRNGQT